MNHSGGSSTVDGATWHGLPKGSSPNPVLGVHFQKATSSYKLLRRATFVLSRSPKILNRLFGERGIGVLYDGRVRDVEEFIPLTAVTDPAEDEPVSPGI